MELENIMQGKRPSRNHRQMKSFSMCEEKGERTERKRKPLL